MAHAPLVTLTTDFGVADGYVGAMKGVILRIAPACRLVDISHEVAPHDVRRAAYVLDVAYPYFPAHAVHLVVVDPGVGGARRAIALRTSLGTFVGPDNGVFGYVLAREPVEALVALTNPRYRLSHVSDTFHGRDVFAPAAARLALGIPIADLGPAVADPVTLPLPRLEIAHDAIRGEVLHIDRFGNVVTSIGRLRWEGEALLLAPSFGPGGASVRFEAAGAVVAAGGRELVGVRHTYGEARPGEMLALVGSGGHLEIAVREGSAAGETGLRPGDEVVVQR